jgi:hypothetical protein
MEGKMPAPKGNQYAKGNKGGRPSKYKPDYAETAGKLCAQPAPEGFVGGNAMRAPWSARVDGSDDVWIANFGVRSLTLMAGADPKGYPSGTKTGDVIHQFQSGSIPYPLDVAIDPAGNVWINHNWNDYEVVISSDPPRRVSTWGGGSGCTVWYGVAAPVKTPLVAQVRKL